MQECRVFDSSGVLYVNSANFGLYDPEAKLVYPPSILLRIRETDWVKKQPVFKRQEEAAPVEAKLLKVVKPVVKSVQAAA